MHELLCGYESLHTDALQSKGSKAAGQARLCKDHTTEDQMPEGGRQQLRKFPPSLVTCRAVRTSFPSFSHLVCAASDLSSLQNLKQQKQSMEKYCRCGRLATVPPNTNETLKARNLCCLVFCQLDPSSSHGRGEGQLRQGLHKIRLPPSLWCIFLVSD